MDETEKQIIRLDLTGIDFEQSMKRIAASLKDYDPGRPALTRQPITGPAVCTGDETFYPTIGYRWRFCWKTYLRNLWRALRGG